MRWQRRVSMAIATTLTAVVVVSCSGESTESKLKGNAAQIPSDNSSNNMSNVTVKAMWMYDWFKGKKWGQIRSRNVLPKKLAFNSILAVPTVTAIRRLISCLCLATTRK